MRPNPWTSTKKTWDEYLQTDEGKGDQRAWKLMEEQRQEASLLSPETIIINIPDECKNCENLRKDCTFNKCPLVCGEALEDI